MFSPIYYSHTTSLFNVKVQNTPWHAYAHTEGEQRYSSRWFATFVPDMGRLSVPQLL